MLRKHVKVEPARYYYYCDKYGLIVWQDMVNGGASVGDVTSFLAIIFGSRKRDKNYRYAGRSEMASRQDFRRELQELVDHLYNFPCIGMWVLYNEGWGQFEANSTSEWLKKCDPSRPIDHASGWFDQGGGDCKSVHVYFKKLPIIYPEKKRAAILSEFGGFSLKVNDNLWNQGTEFGYKKFTSIENLTDAYLQLLEKELEPCIEAGLSAAIYTQTTDVEVEVNGYVTYDREIAKMDFRRLRIAHQKLLEER
jgi:beta-galactosidase/beta-glucuronidase